MVCDPLDYWDTNRIAKTKQGLIGRDINLESVSPHEPSAFCGSQKSNPELAFATAEKDLSSAAATWRAQTPSDAIYSQFTH